MRLRIRRERLKAAPAPKIGRGPGVGVVEVGSFWITELSNDVKALFVTLKVLVNAAERVLELKVEGELTVLKALIAPLGLGLGAELVAATVELKALPIIEDEPVAAHLSSRLEPEAMLIV